MNLAEALVVAIAAAALSSAIAGFVAVINIKVAVAEMQTTLEQNIQSRLLSLEADVKELQQREERG
jgi:hypothetical protein